MPFINFKVGTAQDTSSMKADYKIIALFSANVVLVMLILSASFWAFGQIEVTASARQHSVVVIDRANQLLSALRDAETGQRGYLLSDDEAFLDTYLAERDKVGRYLGDLRKLTLISSAQKHLDTLAPLMAAKLMEMAKAIALNRNHELNATLALVASGSDKQIMDSIRSELSSFIQIENDALAQHEAEVKVSMRQLFAIIVAISLFTLLFEFCLALLIYRDTQQRLKNLLYVETQSLLEAQQHTNRQLQQANVTLQISEEKLAVTLNSIGDAVITTDNEARVTLLNPLAERLTGWTQAEATGRPVDEVFHVINKENRLPASIPVMETLAHGTIQGLVNHTVLISRRGSECDIADSCAPIRDRNGLVLGAVLVFRDVTEKYAIQQALQNGIALHQTIFNTVVDGIITLKAKGGVIVTANAAVEKLFGLSVAKLVGQPISLLIPELQQDYCLNSHQDGGILRELTGSHKDGSKLNIELALSEMWQGKEPYFTGIIRDVTERKRLDQVLLDKNTELEIAKLAAEKASLAKSEFLSSMSHELRTPLNAILGFSQLLEMSSPPPTATQIDRLQQITKAGWYLLELINEILDLALVESGKLSLSHEQVALLEVMDECQALIEVQAQQRKIDLIFVPFDSNWTVYADRTRVKQILINLLSNAVKYNCEQGTVEIKCTESRSGRLRISIRDTGPGLSAEKLAQLFQPFNRLGQEAGAIEGTGIGLVVAKQLVELMGGSIGVESTVCIGTTFWFELLRDVTPQLAVEQLMLTKLTAQKLKNAELKSLLYVEDNPTNLMLVEQILEGKSSLCMLSAKDAMLGIALARAHVPDVILMDINLPGMSGIQALKILLEDPITMHIPIIALSANAMPSDIAKGLEAGFFRYLTKPIKLNEFMIAIDEALEKSNRLVSLASIEEQP